MRTSIIIENGIVKIDGTDIKLKLNDVIVNIFGNSITGSYLASDLLDEIKDYRKIPCKRSVHRKLEKYKITRK